MTGSNLLARLLRSRKVLLALFALVQTVVFELLPGFPRDVWIAIDGLVIAVIAGIAYEDGAKKAAGLAYAAADGAPLRALLHSRKFWLAVFGVAQSLVFYFVPGFPDAVWQAIDGLVVTVILAIAYEDGQQARSAG